MSGGIGNRNEYINQLKTLLPASELEKLNLDEMSDAQLRDKLNQALTNRGNWGEFDGFVKGDNEVVAEQTQQLAQQRTTAENKIEERIISHTEENGKIVEVVIQYKDGKPFKKIKTENGNTVETTTYSEEEVDGFEKVISISTERRDGSTERTYATKIDENGNYTDEDFRQRRTQLISGQVNFVSRDESGNIKETLNANTPDAVVKIYNGSSITDFDNGKLSILQNYHPHTVSDKENAVYTTVNELKENLPIRIDKSLLKDANHKEIFDLFGSNGVLDDAAIKGLLGFIESVVDTNGDGNITELELLTVSEILKESDIKDADFKGFLEALKSGGIHGSVDKKETTTSSLGAVTTEITYDDGTEEATTVFADRTKKHYIHYLDGDSVLTSFYPDGHVKSKMFTVKRGQRVSLDGFRMFIPHKVNEQTINEVVVVNRPINGDDGQQNIPTYNTREYKIARSMRYCRELQNHAAMYYNKENQAVLDMTQNTGTPTIWDGLSSALIEGYSNIAGVESISDMHNQATSNLRRGHQLYGEDVYEGVDRKTYFTAPGVIIYDSDEDCETMVNNFEGVFQSQFGQEFNYGNAEKLRENHDKF